MLFDDDSKGNFHCELCERCYVGGADSYTHCNGCEKCILKENFKGHECVPSTADVPNTIEVPSTIDIPITIEIPNKMDKEIDVRIEDAHAVTDSEKNAGNDRGCLELCCYWTCTALCNVICNLWR